MAGRLDSYLGAMVRVTGMTAMPYGFAASGLLLGLGGVALDRPLAGACGAVAGVTAGLLERRRASDAEHRAGRLRERLREQRVAAEVEASDLRRRIRSLQTQLWERDLRDLGATTELPVLGPPSGPIAQVIDLSEARGQAEPAESQGDRNGRDGRDGRDGRKDRAAG